MPGEAALDPRVGRTLVSPAPGRDDVRKGGRVHGRGEDARRRHRAGIGAWPGRGLTERGHEVSVYSARNCGAAVPDRPLCPTAQRRSWRSVWTCRPWGVPWKRWSSAPPRARCGAVDLAALATKLGYDVRQLPRRSLLEPWPEDFRRNRALRSGVRRGETIRFGAGRRARRQREQVGADVVVGADVCVRWYVGNCGVFPMFARPGGRAGWR